MVHTVSSNSRLFLSAACFGLISGFVEGGVYWLLSIRPDHLGWKNDLVPEILLIAPVFNVVAFLIIALPVGAACCFVPRVRRDVIVFAVFGWLTMYGALAASGKLSRISCVLLSLGVAVQLVRYVRARRPVGTAFFGCTLGGLTTAGVLFWSCPAIFGQQETVYSAALVKSRSAPNVLLIVLDTVRADHLSSYGYSRPTTPNIDRLARDGVLFENAFAESSWTLPSHATLMTGRFTYEHKAGGSPLSDRYPTLAQFLSSKGYTTAGFVANTFYCGPRTGLNRGFAQYQAYFGTVADVISRTLYGKLLLDKLPLVGYYQSLHKYMH